MFQPNVAVARHMQASHSPATERISLYICLKSLLRARRDRLVRVASIRNRSKSPGLPTKATKLQQNLIRVSAGRCGSGSSGHAFSLPVQTFDRSPKSCWPSLTNLEAKHALL